MNRQRGLALSALLLWGVVIALVSIIVIRILPEVIEYYKIRQAVKAVAGESSGKTVPEIRQAFGKYAEVEHVKTIGPADLDVFKEENQIAGSESQLSASLMEIPWGHNILIFTKCSSVAEAGFHSRWCR